MRLLYDLQHTVEDCPQEWAPPELGLLFALTQAQGRNLQLLDVILSHDVLEDHAVHKPQTLLFVDIGDRLDRSA